MARMLRVVELDPYLDARVELFVEERDSICMFVRFSTFVDSVGVMLATSKDELRRVSYVG